jgi:hypothetical protein
VSVKATRLITGKSDSCGCLGYRRDPERHKMARLKVPAALRREIAIAGGKAFADTSVAGDEVAIAKVQGRLWDLQFTPRVFELSTGARSSSENSIAFPYQIKPLTPPTARFITPIFITSCGRA